jgi:uncharacterized protein
LKGGKNNMEKSIKISLIIASTIILLALLIIGSINQFLGASNTLTTEGNSEIEVNPDKVSVRFEILTRGETAEKAENNNTQIFNEIVSNLVEQGFSKEDIKTESFNIHEEYSWKNNQRIFEGYKAIHRIKIKLDSDDSQKIVKVIDSGVSAGALLSGIYFELSQELENTYKTQALESASENAKLKAQAIISGQDKKLGKLVSIRESNFYYQPWNVYESATRDVEVAASEAKQEISEGITPTERIVTARITATYEIR